VSEDDQDRTKDVGVMTQCE